MHGDQSVRLTAGKLKDFESSRGDGVGEQDFMFGGRSKTEMNGSHNSLRDKMTARAQKLSKFDEKSMLDQDDSYGNYRPKFQTKNYKVTGGTSEVMKMQRLASTDKPRALLGPI